MEEIQFTNLNRSQKLEVLSLILEKEYSRKFKKEEKLQVGGDSKLIDLLAYNDAGNQIDFLVELKDNYNDPIHLASQFLMYQKTLKPKVLILVIYAELSKAEKQLLYNELRLKKTGFELYDYERVEKLLKKYPNELTLGLKIEQEKIKSQTQSDDVNLVSYLEGKSRENYFWWYNSAEDYWSYTGVPFEKIRISKPLDNPLFRQGDVIIDYNNSESKINGVFEFETESSDREYYFLIKIFKVSPPYFYNQLQQDISDYQFSSYLRDTFNEITREIAKRIFQVLTDRLNQQTVDAIDLPSLKLESKNFWWLQATIDRWSMSDMEIGKSIPYGWWSKSGKTQDNFKKLRLGDLLVGYQGIPSKKIIGLFQVESINEGKEVFFQLLYKFQNPTTLEELRLIPEFASHRINTTRTGSVHSLTEDLFDKIIATTELRNLEHNHKRDNNLRRTHIHNDGAYTSEDLLEIENDVRSFALLLASIEVEPPLAVALFGNWGSGKSFFMKHLAKKVNELSQYQCFYEPGIEDREPPDQEIFCKSIAQIEFNAWSYLDANLWAGLISSIFEKLDEFISNKSKGENEKIKIRKALSEKLYVLESEKKIITEKKEDLIKEKQTLESKIETLKTEKKKLLEKAAKKELHELIKEAQDKVKLDDEIKQQLDDFGISVEKFNKLSPGQLYQQIQSWYTFFNNLKYFKAVDYFYFAAAFLILLFFWINPNDLASSFTGLLNRQLGMTLSFFAPFIVKIGKTYNRFNRLIEPITDFKNKYNQTFEQVKFNYEKELDLLNTKISEKESDIRTQEQSLVTVSEKIEDLQYTLDHFIAKRAFNNFVQRRISEKHYDQHLGLISIIRRDFETLSNLFLDNNEAVDAYNKTQIDKKKEHEEFAKLFENEKLLDRIVLYIDDLDRCSDQKVLEVIQAVHLLMAFPLFNVVVGVDKRCVNNALLLKTKLEYRKIAPIKEIEDLGVELISPSEYLEKIFQIPFELREPSHNDLGNLVNSLLGEHIEFEVVGNDQPDEGEIIGGDNTKKKSQSTEGTIGNVSSDFQAYLKKTKENEQLIVPTPQNLQLTKVEVEMLTQFIPLLGSTPRIVKRYINIYRIIRSHTNSLYSDDKKGDNYLLTMFILALGIGNHRDVIEHYYKRLERDGSLNIESILKNVGLVKTEKVIEQIKKGSEISKLLNMKGNQIDAELINLTKRFSFGKEIETIKTIEA